MKSILPILLLAGFVTACSNQQEPTTQEETTSSSSQESSVSSNNIVQQDTFTRDGSRWKQYNDDRVDITFEYRVKPDGYIAVSTEQEDAFGIAVIKTTDYEYMKDGPGRGGPPAISIIVYPNEESLSAQEWALANTAYSNLQTEEQATEVIVAGNAGIRYAWEGMLNGETIVVTNNQKLYMLSVTSNEGESTMKEDFDTLLQSIEFSM